MLSSHLRLGLPIGLFPSDFPTKTLYVPLLFPLHTTCPTHLILLDFITWIIFVEQYRSKGSSLRSLPPSSVSSSLLCSNLFLSTLFLNTLSLCLSFNVSDQDAHPYKTTGKTVVLYILIFTYLHSKLEDKRFCTEWQQAFPEFTLLLISSCIEFGFVRVIPKYVNYSTISEDLLPIFM